MEKDLITNQRQELINQYGPWTAHNIKLADDLYIMDPSLKMGQVPQMKAIVQIIKDLSTKPIHELRILDLACLEGVYSVELAKAGAQVVGIEGREANIEKARFVKRVLDLKNLEFIQDDVRNLSSDRYGKFDVVICAGILYHLDAPDVFHFLEKIYEVCKGFVIIDSHFSLTSRVEIEYKAKQYFGLKVMEHRIDSSLEERKKLLHASLDNSSSFWFTRASLFNFLTELGFSTIFECHAPPIVNEHLDRGMFVAIKNQKQSLKSVSDSDYLETLLYPKDYQRKLSQGHPPIGRVGPRRFVRNFLKKFRDRILK